MSNDEQDPRLNIDAGGLPRRRASDPPPHNLELILYQLAELKAAVREGFAKMEGRFDAAEARIAALERFREREEERARTESAQTSRIDSRWLPLLIAFIGVAATILVFVLGNGGA